MVTLRMFEHLNNRSYRPSDKQLLNNFLGRFFRKANFPGEGQKWIAYKKKVYNKKICP